MRERARRALLPITILVLVTGHLFTTTLHWRCPIARLSHHPCPTCGMSTAAKLLLHGKLAAGFAVHPLSLVVVPLVVVVSVLELGTYVKTGQLGRWTGTKPLQVTILITAIAVFVLWIARFFGAFGGPVRVG